LFQDIDRRILIEPEKGGSAAATFGPTMAVPGGQMA
jgi:hypothetical protein